MECSDNLFGADMYSITKNTQWMLISYIKSTRNAVCKKSWYMYMKYKKLLQRPQKPRSGTKVWADTIIKQISM